MGWIEVKFVWLGFPHFADAYEWSEALEGLQPASISVGVDKVVEMRSQLGMAVIMVPFDGGLLDRPVRPFDLPIGPGMLDFGEPVSDPVLFGPHVELVPSGLYAWHKNPPSQRAREDARQTELLRRAWNDSGKVYGYRKLHDDLLDHSATCCPNRVARFTRLAGIRAQVGYKRRPGSYGGRPSLAIDNTLGRQFDVAAPDRAWVTDITYIRSLEGFAYLAVVIDLYSRRVVGWSMQSRQTTDVVLQALHMAVWRRKATMMASSSIDKVVDLAFLGPVGRSLTEGRPEVLCVRS